jgi:acetyl-CoA/propionyl-CoA carboxylase biotin carboxyl carrier protein
MPGTVVSVEAVDGGAVEAGAGVVVIEAMKMEHRLVAPLAGTARVHVRVGDRVTADQELAVIEGAEPLAASAPQDPAACTPGDAPVPTPDGITPAEDLRPLPTMEG